MTKAPTATFAERIAAVERAGDSEAVSAAAANLARVQLILAQYTGDTPGIPPTKVIGEIYDLLHRAVNPDGKVGQPRLDNGPDYPTKWLPEPMQAQLDARGALADTGVGAAMLGCGSAAALPADLTIEDQRVVVPTLWVASIGDAGCGKTPAHEIVFAPYRRRESTEANRYVSGMRDWVTLDRKEKAQMPRPVNGSKLSEDATLELIARRLQAPGGALALVADELSGLLRSIGQYKRDGGGDKARFLSLWSGQPWTYERVGNSEDPLFIHIDRPIVPVFGTIQPEFVGLLGDVGSGMQARWLPHLCGHRSGTQTGLTADGWERAVRVMLAEIERRRHWRMSAGGEARAEHIRAEERWAEERRDVSQTAASTAFLAKGGEHAGRVALIVAEIDAAGAAADVGGRIQAGELPVWAIRAGIDLVDYVAAVWRAVPDGEAPMAMSFADRAIAERDGRLNAWLRAHGGSATRREIHRAHVGGARTAKDVDALIERHQAMYGEGTVVPERGGIRVYAG